MDLDFLRRGCGIVRHLLLSAIRQQYHPLWHVRHQDRRRPAVHPAGPRRGAAPGGVRGICDQAAAGRVQVFVFRVPVPLPVFDGAGGPSAPAGDHAAERGAVHPGAGVLHAAVPAVLAVGEGAAGFPEDITKGPWRSDSRVIYSCER